MGVTRIKKILCLALLLQGCTTTIDFGLGDVRKYHSIPVKAELADVLKNPEKYDGKQLTVAGNIFIWSEISVLCIDDQSEKLKPEEKCLALSYAESMYFKYHTKDGRPAERIKGNHSGKYVSATGYFKTIHIPTEEELKEIYEEYPLAPISQRHRLEFVYRISDINK